MKASGVYFVKDWISESYVCHIAFNGFIRSCQNIEYRHVSSFNSLFLCTALLNAVRNRQPKQLLSNDKRIKFEWERYIIVFNDGIIETKIKTDDSAHYSKIHP